MGSQRRLAPVIVLFFPIFLRSLFPAVRYTTFAEADETIRMYADSGLPGTHIARADEWNRWIHEQDRSVRARIDRGIEDSICNLVLYGTSFTATPRIENSADALRGTGQLSAAARVRVRALIAALERPGVSERLRFVREFLARKKIPAGGSETFLSSNLVRFVREQLEYESKLDAARHSDDPSAVFTTRATLYANRGLSVDTSLLPNLALDETLQALYAKGVLRPGSIHRIAIIGPGLDFTILRTSAMDTISILCRPSSPLLLWNPRSGCILAALRSYGCRRST